MTTEAQINANRANAQNSTGPRTPQGKAKVAQNAVQHGLLAKEAVVVGEDFDQFDLYREQIRAELGPVGLVESVLVERIVGLSWRLQRAERFHTEAFDVLYAQCAADPHVKRRWPAPGPDQADPILGVTVVNDFSQTRVLERLMMYERRIENSLYRTMAELRKLQGQRKSAGGVPGTGEKEAVRDTHPTDLTLDKLLGAIAALEETPAGGTTNAPAEPSCETKPICAGSGEEVGRGRPTLDQVGGRLHEEGPQTRENAFGNPETPDGVTTNLAEAGGQPCETKPIVEGIRVQGSGVNDLTPDTRPPTPGPSCETKPICAGANRSQAGYRPIFRRRR